jgi:hypothetical protein
MVFENHLPPSNPQHTPEKPRLMPFHIAVTVKNFYSYLTPNFNPVFHTFSLKSLLSAMAYALDISFLAFVHCSLLFAH